jgi:hypothetical protein
MKNFKTVKGKVKELLETWPKYRDNDLSLVSHFWNDQIEGTGVHTATAFLKYHAAGQLTSSDVITRARRQLQEEHVELRGMEWARRHKQLQEEAQKELGYGA